MPAGWRRTVTPIALALVSLLAAVALWVAVTDSERPLNSYDFGGGLIVNAINVPQGLAIAGMSDTVVFVRVRASEEAFSELSTADFVAEVNMSGERQETSNKAISVRVLGRNDVEIIEVSPSTIQVLLDDEASKQVPVQINRLGATPQGIVVSLIEPNPTTVTVSGAASLIGRVESASADINLTGLRVNQQQQYVLTARDSSNTDLRPIRIQPNTVDVRVTVDQTGALRSIPVTLRTRGQVAEGYNLTSVSLDQASITVEGPVAVIQALRSIETEEFDLTGMDADETRAVRLRLPTGITSLRDSVNVTFNIEPSIATWTLSVTPAAENTPDGLQVLFQTTAVSVVIRGELPTLNRLADGAIRAVVDLTDLDEGIHLVQAEIRLPQEITLVSVDPEEIVVVLQP
ncbi:MAG TPA: CdaR family protein [Dehalococcoidia bacterium]|nr:CdaR family protein [Dehalococcoidia bacterium]